jgi:rRNA biogenesis protein RRP5
MFEGILSTYPRRLDIWNQLLDLEIQQIVKLDEEAKLKKEKTEIENNKEIIRELFERLLKTKGVKEKGALAWFKRWGKWEEEKGDTKSQEKVRAKAQEWVSAEKARRAAAAN